MGADDPGARSSCPLAFEELAVDRDVARARDLASREDAVGADEQLRTAPERDRARLEEALDLDGRALVELQGRVAEHVAATEVAVIGGARRRAPDARDRLAREKRPGPGLPERAPSRPRSGCCRASRP